MTSTASFLDIKHASSPYFHLDRAAALNCPNNCARVILFAKPDEAATSLRSGLSRVRDFDSVTTVENARRAITRP